MSKSTNDRETAFAAGLQSLVPPETPHTNRGVSLRNQITGASIDWLTVTTDVRRIGIAWADFFAEIAAENGFSFTKPWAFWGFIGWQTEHCRYGRRLETGEHILIVSSWPADRLWQKVCPVARNVTRLDLAVTLKMDVAQPGVGAAHYAAIEGNNQRKNSLMVNRNGGETLYIGSRHSDQFGRFYDKGVQMKKEPPGTIYRYEVVVKKGLTPILLKSLLAGANVPGEKAVLAHKIRAFVWDWFDNRDITPIFSRGQQDRLELSVEFTATTVDRKLKWLAHAVSPTIRKLMAEGRSKDVIEALSLEALMTEPDPAVGL